MLGWTEERKTTAVAAATASVRRTRLRGKVASSRWRRGIIGRGFEGPGSRISRVLSHSLLAGVES